MQFGKAGLLSAFDANRDLIYAAAARVRVAGKDLTTWSVPTSEP